MRGDLTIISTELDKSSNTSPPSKGLTKKYLTSYRFFGKELPFFSFIA